MSTSTAARRRSRGRHLLADRLRQHQTVCDVARIEPYHRLIESIVRDRYKQAFHLEADPHAPNLQAPSYRWSSPDGAKARDEGPDNTSHSKPEAIAASAGRQADRRLIAAGSKARRVFGCPTQGHLPEKRTLRTNGDGHVLIPGSRAELRQITPDSKQPAHATPAGDKSPSGRLRPAGASARPGGAAKPRLFAHRSRERGVPGFHAHVRHPRLCTFRTRRKTTLGTGNKDV